MKRTFITLLAGAAVLCISGSAFARTHDADGQSRGNPYMGARPYTKMEPSAGVATREVTTLARSEVRSIQRELDKRGYATGPADGIFGPRTQKALREFQDDNDLATTGTPNADTLDELGIQISRADQNQSGNATIYWSGPRTGGVNAGEPSGTFRRKDSHTPQ